MGNNIQDFIGQDLAIGDFVIIKRPNNRGLMIGQVDSFTSKKVRIKHEQVDIWPYGGKNITIITGSNCVKVDPYLAVAKVLANPISKSN